MRPLVLAAAFAALVLSFAAAGCGGSGDTQAGQSVLTPAEWRREVNAICRDVGRKVRRVRSPQSKGEIAPFIAAVLPLWRREADAVRTLVPPQELAAAAGQYVTQLDYLATWLLEIYVAGQRHDDARQGDGIRKSAASAGYVTAWAGELRLATCAAQRIP